MITSYDIADRDGMMTDAEIELLKRCVADIPPNSLVVNIGAGAGTSVVAMLEERPDIFIFSVDVKPVLKERQALLEADVPENRCVRLLGKSWIVGAEFPFDVALVFVDGAHYGEAVQNDIDTWLPKVQPHGFILFHDYDHRNCPDLKRIVDIEMQNYDVIGKERYLKAFQI